MSEFKPSVTDNRRVQIIDVSHLFYKYAFGGATDLSTTIVIDGVPTRVNTTLPNYVIKQIHRWAKFGVNPTVVCFDGRGCNKCRKAYFSKESQNHSDAEAVDYKGTREIQNSTFYEGVNLTMNMLMQGGVTVLKADKYEADDLVKAAIDKAKIQYPDLPIDVVTGDADLIPLVDDQVSVFISSRVTTWAETSDIEKRHYYQITPNNYQSYVEGLSAYKNLTVPYNTLLLTKLLRGDKSDGIPGYPKFTPKKYNALIQVMQENNEDFNIFRYDTPKGVISYRDTELPIPEELIESTPNEQKMIKYQEPECLTKIVNVLSNYLSPEEVEHVKFIYKGINLNTVFVGLGETFNRRPANITVDIKSYLAVNLQYALSLLKINLPMG